MELESMKSLWQAQEQQIKQVSALSDNMLQRMIRDKSHGSLEKIRNTEYLVGCLTLLFFALFLLMGSKVGNSAEMVIAYTITMAAFAIELCVSAYKLLYLSRIDMSAGAVTDTVKKTQQFRLFIVRERIISIAAIFVVAPAVYICVYRWTKHESALDHLPFT